MHIRRSLLATVLVAGLVASGAAVAMSPEEGYGPRPVLPEPDTGLIPTIKVAKAIGWAADGKPTPAPGLAVTRFADGLDHPRWLLVLPNGDVLVAESNAPPKEETKGIKEFATGLAQSYAGAGVDSANRITLLRDQDGDGKAETKSIFMQDLTSPFGMALVGDRLFVANADAVVSVPYHEGETRIDATPTKVLDLPGGPINHHWTKNLIASPDGGKLFITVGSNSNVAENGIDAEAKRAAIIEYDLATGKERLFATGLRNPNGLAWQKETGALWTTVNERDELGDDLVPDYMTAVQDGGFYGWPYSYYGQHVDERIKEQRPDLVARALVPDYGLGAHTASLGLSFADGTTLPEHYREGAFVGQHGSWNRSEPAGYKVIFVPFKDGKPAGMPEDVLTGFLNAEGHAQGRPVGVAIDKAGGLLVADDVGNAIWRVTAAR